MSVNAINGVNPQQGQDKRSVLPGAIAGGTVLGTAGAAAGYMWGGKSPSLAEVFAQEDDAFTKTMDKLGETDSEAVKTLKEERNAILSDAGIADKKTAYEQKLSEVSDAINDRTDYANKAELDQALADATAERNNLAQDATKVQKDAAEAKLEKAKYAVFEAKSEKFVEDANTKTLRDQLHEAGNNFRNAVNESVEGSSLKKDSVKEAFGKVKSVLVEGRGKAAAIWGACALVTGLAIGALLSTLGKAKNSQN